MVSGVCAGLGFSAGGSHWGSWGGIHWGGCAVQSGDGSAIHGGGVQVDRCFSCNGTWLDAGELEKLAKDQKGDSITASILRIFR